MEVGILSMRYAKAIIEYAQEKGLEDRLYQEFLTLSHSFCEQPGLREALDNPVITTKEELALVCTAADGDGKSTKLITAVPVNKETEDRIRSAAAHILHAQMELETVIDPSIEGGFIFDINDYRLDASVATQLKRVKQQFIDKNRRIV